MFRFPYFILCFPNSLLYTDSHKPSVLVFGSLLSCFCFTLLFFSTVFHTKSSHLINHSGGLQLHPSVSLLITSPCSPVTLFSFISLLFLSHPSHSCTSSFLLVMNSFIRPPSFASPVCKAACSLLYISTVNTF